MRVVAVYFVGRMLRLTVSAITVSLVVLVEVGNVFVAWLRVCLDSSLARKDGSSRVGVSCPARRVGRSYYRVSAIGVSWIIS